MKQIHSLIAALLFALSPLAGYAGVNDPHANLEPGATQDYETLESLSADASLLRLTLGDDPLTERCVLLTEEDPVSSPNTSDLWTDTSVLWDEDAWISSIEDGAFSVELPLLEGSLTQAVAVTLRRAAVGYERSLQAAVSSPVFPRLARDGDSLELKFALDTDTGLPQLQALVFYLGSEDTPIKMYRFAPFGSASARYFDTQGYEYRLGLLDSPLDYRTISSFLGDGRRHQGLDLTAAVGTPIRTPWRAVVEKVNWNAATQGLCVQLLYADLGIRAKFFHLSRIDRDVRPGTELEEGRYFSRSGNTGRSTGPHLHYQLEDAQTGRILNPIEVHGYGAPRLEPAALSWFEGLVAALESVTTPERSEEASVMHLLNSQDALY